MESDPQQCRDFAYEIWSISERMSSLLTKRGLHVFRLSSFWSGVHADTFFSEYKGEAQKVRELISLLDRAGQYWAERFVELEYEQRYREYERQLGLSERGVLDIAPEIPERVPIPQTQ